MARAGWALAVAAAVVVLDQLTKALVRSSLALGDERHVLPGLKLQRAANHGVAFSLAFGGEALTVALIAVVLAGLVAYFLRHREAPLLWLASGLIAGGAVGNLLDRLRYGAVTDFVKLPLWPAFNVADAAITVGVLVLIWSVGSDARRRPA
jgi:signal peptidase II